MTAVVPHRVVVVGGGRMGSGIAVAFAAAGSGVAVVESDQGRVEAARKSVEGLLCRTGCEAQVDVTADWNVLAGAGLVIEAVPEDPALKIDVLRRAESSAPGAWLATNTSSISIDELASGLEGPQRLVGLHFFNPVPSSLLVEVVIGERTHGEVAFAAPDWVAALGKTPIVVRDVPGFASSRLGVALALEAMRMLEAEVATAEDIDAAMTLGYRHAMGPLRTTDLVGLDVRLDIARYLERELGPTFKAPQILVDLVEAGRLGRKTGEGFYAW